MVRVFTKGFFTSTFMVMCCLSNSSKADGVLQDPLKKDIQENFQKKVTSDNDATKQWLDKALEDTKSVAIEIKTYETALKAKSAQMSAKTSAEIMHMLAPEIERALDFAAANGWRKTLKAIQTKVETKNLVLPDLEKNSALLLKLVQKVAVSENAYWELVTKSEQIPKTETVIQITPKGTALSHELRVIGVLAAMISDPKVKESLKISEQPRFLRKFLELNIDAPKTN